MEEHEKYLGEVTSIRFRRYMGGLTVIATSMKLIGVKGWNVSLIHLEKRLNLLAESKLSKDDVDELFKKALKSKEFEIGKDDIKVIRLKKPGPVRLGTFNILLKSGKEIKLYLDDSSLFYRVGELMQAFYPEAVELDN